MRAFKKISDRNDSLLNWLEFSLIILSSVLLGIWAVANTIALRNISLVLGTLLSLVYLYQLHRQDQLKKYFGFKNSISLFCITGLFLWVLAHCFLFPTDYPVQIQELQSTWLRSALAATVGVAAGIAIVRNPAKIYWLWIGMTVTFLCLFSQYIQDAWQQQKLFTENAMHYLFLGKVNGVLIGNVLIAGLLGSFSDAEFDRKKNKIIVFTSLIIISLVLFSYVFILESRNGIVIAFILIIIWITCLLKKTCQSSKKNDDRIKVLYIILFMFFISLFFYKHLERTPQWRYLVEDIKISSKIDQFKAWKHSMEEGPPASPEGRYISTNTYLRIAWFVTGMKLIPEAGLGHGVLHESFQRALDHSQFNGAKVKSTHSAFLDFFLAFGLLGVILLLLPLPLIFIKNHFSRGSSTASWISFTLAVLFVITESTSKHSIEILLFLICMLTIFGSDYEKKFI